MTALQEQGRRAKAASYTLAAAGTARKNAALEAIAEKAMEKDTGARALRAIIEEFMLDIMYEIPKDDNIGQVTITREYIEGTGGPVIQLRSQSVPLLSQPV